MRIHTPAGAVAPPDAATAAPPAGLDGLRIGILDNTKPNAGLLLGRLADRIAERTGAEVRLVETKNAALPAPDDGLARLAKEVEVVLTGSAD